MYDFFIHDQLIKLNVNIRSLITVNKCILDKIDLIEKDINSLKVDVNVLKNNSVGIETFDGGFIDG
nr:MAG TPA: hypothetical protein [Inoviridae sp.]